MSKFKDKMAAALYKIRNPEEDPPQFRRELGFKRFLFLAPFIIAALIFFLLSLVP
jgi:hypothetical protein